MNEEKQGEDSLEAFIDFLDAVKTFGPSAPETKEKWERWRGIQKAKLKDRRVIR